MADTASLDVARYLNVADWNSLSITTPAKSVAYLNGKLANAATDNGSPATLTETAGVWLNGTFTPEAGSDVGTPVQLVRCYY